MLPEGYQQRLKTLVTQEKGDLSYRAFARKLGAVTREDQNRMANRINRWFCRDLSERIDDHFYILLAGLTGDPLAMQAYVEGCSVTELKGDSTRIVMLEQRVIELEKQIASLQAA